jgi:D-sedoheptulose 7-phosphate isomerase
MGSNNTFNINILKVIMIKKKVEEIANNFYRLSKIGIEDIQKAKDVIINSLSNGNKIMFCGNGGSAADSQHLAAELIGRYKINREPLSALALTTDTSTITAVSNDFSFDDIFSRQIKALGKKGDVLYAISTSGNSKNVINAIKQSRKQEIIVIGITGEEENKMDNICDILIKVPASQPDRIQEMHIAVGQIICDEIEKFFFDN